MQETLLRSGAFCTLEYSMLIVFEPSGTNFAR